MRVRARLSSPSAGTEAGADGARQLSFAFRVATPVRTAPAEAGRRGGRAPAGTSHTGYGPTQAFHSEPHLRPPALISQTRDPDAASGEVFVAPENSPQVGPMILGARGQLVWFHPLSNGSQSYYAADFAIQHYQDRPVLTWWQGTVAGGMIRRPAYDVIMSDSYRRLAVVRAGDGYAADQHEFQITPSGTAYLDASTLTRANLTSVGGPPNAPVMDYVIQEVDIRTGQVLWEWHALGHVPVSASYLHYNRRDPWYDFFHLNSIQQLAHGNLLVSARDTWAVYEISRSTGKVIWTLGGKHSNFQMGPGTRFEWQHDARLQGQVLSLFDDAAYPQEERQSSAKYLRIDPRARTVSLIRRFTHQPPMIAGAGGNAQVLPNGNLFVGWGSQPQFSEYTAAGREIFNASFALRVVSYRAMRFPWTGHPVTRPSLSVSGGRRGHMKAYASWNGATQVADWRVLGGSSRRTLKPLGLSAAASGFETVIDLPTGPRYFAVEALGEKGRVLGTSAARPEP